MCVNSTIVNVLWFNKILLVTSIIKLALIHECISPKSYIEIMQRKSQSWKIWLVENQYFQRIQTLLKPTRLAVPFVLEYLENIDFREPKTTLKVFSLFLCICTALYVGDFVRWWFSCMPTGVYVFKPNFSFEDMGSSISCAFNMWYRYTF